MRIGAQLSTAWMANVLTGRASSLFAPSLSEGEVNILYLFSVGGANQ